MQGKPGPAFLGYLFRPGPLPVGPKRENAMSLYENARLLIDGELVAAKSGRTMRAHSRCEKSQPTKHLLSKSINHSRMSVLRKVGTAQIATLLCSCSSTSCFRAGQFFFSNPWPLCRLVAHMPEIAFKKRPCFRRRSKDDVKVEHEDIKMLQNAQAWHAEVETKTSRVQSRSLIQGLKSKTNSDPKRA